MRRQNRSCDQCRKSKRACDVYFRDPQQSLRRLNAAAGRANNVSLAESYLGEPLRLPHYSSTHHLYRSLKFGTNGSNQRVLQTTMTPVSCPAPTAGEPKSNAPYIGLETGFDATLMIQFPLQLAVMIRPASPTVSPCTPKQGPHIVQLHRGSTLMPQTCAMFPGRQRRLPVRPREAKLRRALQLALRLPAAPSALYQSVPPASSRQHMATQAPNSQPPSSASGKDDKNDSSLIQAHSHTNAHRQPVTPVSNSKRRNKSFSVGLTNTDNASISPFSAGHTMIMNTNKRIISNNLISIYQNAFELALACCLSQEACPYQFNAISQPSTSGISWLASRVENVHLLNQYNPKKQNTGVYYRVFQLDKVAQANKLVRLSKAENRAVSEALYLAIMAFAIQWAQESRHQCGTHAHTSGSIESLEFDIIDTLSGEFDRTLQKTLWAQASLALQRCADIECFRVVCAEWIMALTQKPIDRDDFTLDIPRRRSSGSKIPIVGREGTVASQIDDIIAADGPPWYIERASRRIHALKFRYDSHKACILDSYKGSSKPERTVTVESISDENMGTFNLMYWMTIMIDTVSAVINNRPVVISDTACHHDPKYLGRPELEQFAIDHHPYDIEWWATIFNQESDNQTLRWPCLYETAVKIIVAVTPVKVVLFRHVSQLQDTLRSHYRGESIENIISNAMAIYKHWNMNYGAFFRDMVDQYHTVPMQMRIWCVHAVAYFHCAVLILADLIELVDGNGLGLEHSSQIRINIGVVKCLRMDSTKLISDLAKASGRPPDIDIPGLNLDVVKRVILPEPWTMILIRVFTKVAMIRLTEIEEAVRNTSAFGSDG
ncbi:hypothetical protein G7Z17_g2895 [Cylindrodendrum hubeiense]|uniref:Uncharacterized protein n=1 Tax=Cylindrodendrum hubeiense TaxID=595255 RepID=A0A9P5HDG6_9HYPO|nr:hypothetical protein G7Z17_g2895 [Cylindrodendrum hubeiense]